MKAPASLRSRNNAFSLVELLTVVAILAILAVVSSSALTNVKRGTELKTSATQVIDALALARQSAVAMNSSVEVRIYSKDGKFFIKLFRLATDGSVAEQIGRIVRLPESVIFSTNPVWSTALTDAITGPELSDAQGPYRKFHMKSNGATDLAGSAPATLTLIFQSDSSSPSLPSNFFTLQIDLQTGSIAIFRPS